MSRQLGYQTLFICCGKSMSLKEIFSIMKTIMKQPKLTNQMLKQSFTQDDFRKYSLVAQLFFNFESLCFTENMLYNLKPAAVRM
ncbi:hypothetical protein ABVT39_004948, partial [Epinephelus coioides]